MKPKNKKQPKRSAPLWMVTYSDMMTLILVFFILLFSMSQIDATKFNAVAESYRQNVIFDFMPSPIEEENPTDFEEESETNGENDSEDDSQPNQEPSQDITAEEDQENLDEIYEEIQAYLDENELNDMITANQTDQGIVLVLQERVLFETGEAELIEDFQPFLDQLALLLDNMPNNVEVEGHTDDRPINTYRYPSNWELSTARASSVIRYFIEEHSLDPTRFEATGYAEYRPVSDNNSEDNLQRNRRVEMVILELDQGSS
ncbi:flagellar motor protein MotS [Alkalibacillus salilacus]|uniref:Chemotaxis protein MotB n=1 Tax=Alkalibacillus salilacus TaxID=284582 RepID=A0ABT9VGQ7_9BACI|nr:flagellar motor protein MotS [Alkalibacillus salilacus]MDQ0160152.1 chemotaxis protein MotB [Alkalibacillus salilacus]